MPSPHDIEVKLVATGFNDNRLEDSLEITLYRVIQQGLANAVQHSQAKRVTVDLRWHDDEITLVLADDGIGFDVQNPKEKPETGHYGLINLKSRIENSSGQMDIESKTGVGTTLRATIPFAGPQSGSDEPKISTHILQKQPAPQPAPQPVT